MSGICHNCGESLESSRDDLENCPGCSAGLTSTAGFMPEDMDLGAADHHLRLGRRTGGDE